MPDQAAAPTAAGSIAGPRGAPWEIVSELFCHTWLSIPFSILSFLAELTGSDVGSMLTLSVFSADLSQMFSPVHFKTSLIPLCHLSPGRSKLSMTLLKFMAVVMVSIPPAPPTDVGAFH